MKLVDGVSYGVIMILNKPKVLIIKLNITIPNILSTLKDLKIIFLHSLINSLRRIQILQINNKLKRMVLIS